MRIYQTVKWDEINELNYPHLDGNGYKIIGRLKVDPQVHCISGVIPAKAGIQDRLRNKEPWIPASAGMTYHKSKKAHVPYVHISPYFTSAQSEGFQPFPREI
jgi:hypothetical protein